MGLFCLIGIGRGPTGREHQRSCQARLAYGTSSSLVSEARHVLRTPLNRFALIDAQIFLHGQPIDVQVESL